MTAFLLICLVIGLAMITYGALLDYASGMADANVGDSGGCSIFVVGALITLASGGVLLARLFL